MSGAWCPPSSVGNPGVGGRAALGQKRRATSRAGSQPLSLPERRDDEVRTGSVVLPSLNTHKWLARIVGVDVADVRALVARLPLLRQLRCARLRRLSPLANGQQHGLPIVRHYWAQFLAGHRADIHGRGLEIGTTETIRHYGGAALTGADAIDLASHNPEVTVVADLTKADELPGNVYDCFVNQFTMHLIYDLDSALYHSLRLLKPGGVLLANFPSVEYCFSRGLDMGTGAPLFVFWQFTPLQVENLLRRLGLADADFELELFGNLFTRVAYQMNMPAEELTRTELDYVDPGHPLLICARVVKPTGWNVPTPAPLTPWLPDVAPARWNPVTGHYAA
jgi:SAM-dependent methyltransferase